MFLDNFAPVAQLDRVSGFEPGGREFESLRARQLFLIPVIAQPLSLSLRAKRSNPGF